LPLRGIDLLFSSFFSSIVLNSQSSIPSQTKTFFGAVIVKGIGLWILKGTPGSQRAQTKRIQRAER
jgi:hypothetical protein